MKFTSYQKAVSANSSVNPNTRMSGDINAYGGNMNGYSGLIDGLNKVNQEYIKQKENDLVVATTEANNEYNKRINDLLYNEKEGLMHKELSNAKDLTGEFEIAERKIRNEVLGTVPQYEKAHIAFNAMSDKSVMQNLQAVRNRQYEQTEKHKGVVYEANINNISDLAIKSQDPKQILGAINQMHNVTAGMYLDQKGEEAVTLLNREKDTVLAENAIIQILSNGNAGDWQQADTVLKMTEKYVDPAKLSNLRSMINKYQKADEKNSLIKELRTKFGTDIKSASEWLRQNNTTEVTTTGSKEDYNIPLSTGDNPDIDGLKPEFKSALKSIGGTIKKLGLENGALITSGNRNEERNRLAGGVTNSYHTSGDALDIYFPNLNEEQQQKLIDTFKPNFGEVLYHDAGSGYHLHLGNYKGGLENGETKTITETKYSEEELKSLETAFIGDIQREEQIKNFGIQQTIEDTGNKFLQMYQQGNIDITQYEKIAATASNGDDKVFRSLMGIARTYCSPTGVIGRSGKSGSGSKGDKFDLGVKPQLKELMGKGTFKTKQDFVDFVLRYKPSASEFNEMMSEYDKWENGKGEYSFDWDSIKASAKAISGIKDDDGLWEQTWHGTKEYVVEYINNYIKENNCEPSYNQVIGAVKDAYVKNVYQNKTTPFYNFWNDNSIKYSAVDLINAGIKSTRYLPDGNVAVYYSNGGEDTVTPSQLDEYIKQQRGEIETIETENRQTLGKAAMSAQEALDLANNYITGNYDNPNYNGTD